MWHPPGVPVSTTMTGMVLKLDEARCDHEAALASERQRVDIVLKAYAGHAVRLETNGSHVRRMSEGRIAPTYRATADIDPECRRKTPNSRVLDSGAYSESSLSDWLARPAAISWPTIRHAEKAVR